MSAPLSWSEDYEKVSGQKVADWCLIARVSLQLLLQPIDYLLKSSGKQIRSKLVMVSLCIAFAMSRDTQCG